MALDPLTAVTDLINGVGGKLIERLWPDPTQAQAAKIELAKMAESGELARLANETEQVKSFLSDTASARDREAKIATSADAPRLNKIITPLLSIGILGGAFLMFCFMIFIVDETIGTSQKEIIIYILGVLSALATQVCSYYFGSSRGDAAKDQHIRDLMKNSH
jgi:hypothetical protein